MSDKDLFEEYMDYKLSGYEADEKPGESSGCLTWILGMLAAVWTLSKLFC